MLLKIIKNRKAIAWPYVLALVLAALLIVVMAILYAQGSLKLGSVWDSLLGRF